MSICSATKWSQLLHSHYLQNVGQESLYTPSWLILLSLDFPGGSDGKASVYNAGDPGSIPGLGRAPREGNGNPLQYYSLENPMDRGAWKATVHGVAKSWTRLSDFTSLHFNHKQSRKFWSILRVLISIGLFSLLSQWLPPGLHILRHLGIY